MTSQTGSLIHHDCRWISRASKTRCNQNRHPDCFHGQNVFFPWTSAFQLLSPLCSPLFNKREKQLFSNKLWYNLPDLKNIKIILYIKIIKKYTNAFFHLHFYRWIIHILMNRTLVPFPVCTISHPREVSTQVVFL